jgi:sigma-B regulation protein RsbU (phosphoserine phosphatase)
MENGPARLLVVDDNEMNRDLLSRRLRQEGHFVTTANDGRQALERIHAEPFDLVLLDVMMPEMDGYRVLEQLRQEQWLFRLPVIMISAISELDSVVRCIELGATDYLPKPFNAVLLKARVAATLERKRLRDRERLRTESLERELEIGRQIQATFFPDELPRPAGWEIEARFQAARQVAGDFYDAFPIRHQSGIGLVVADVCDKGVGAALFMALFRSLIRAATESGPDRLGRETSPGFDASARLLYAVAMTNDYIARTHSRANMFATLFFAILDPATGSLVYVNGGHEAPVLRAASGAQTRLAPTGPAVGMLPGAAFETREARLDDGDLLLAFTDGVSEARDAEGRFFTEERLLTLLRQPAATASDALDRIEASLREHTGGGERSDDVTLLAVRRGGGIGSGGGE